MALIRIGRVIALTSMSRSTIERNDKDPTSDFPKSRHLTARIKVWDEDELAAWITSRRKAA